MKKLIKIFRDSKIMFLRCVKVSLRNPETLIMSIIVPAFMMMLFVFIFGGVIDIDAGGDFNYVNFIIAGIILQCIAQGSMTTALGVSGDMNKGMMDRFRSMPISKASFLVGHSLAAVARSVLMTAVTIAVAFAVGFRPQATFGGWMVIIGMLLLFVLLINWLAVLLGLIAKNAESAGSLMALIAILPYLSSGFAPTETMPAAIRVFANNQPMTPIINTIRAMITGTSAGSYLWIAIAWCAGLIALFFGLALWMYKRRLSR